MIGKDIKEIMDFLYKEKKMWRALKKYIHADYFNQSEDLKDLYDFLVKWFNQTHKKEAQWTSTAIEFISKKRKQRGASTTFGKHNLENLMSRLLNLIEDFLAFQNYTASPIHKHLAITKYARKNNLDRLFKKQLRKTKNELKKYPHFSLERSFLEHEIVHLEYQFFHHEKRTDKNNLQLFSNQIDTNFLITRLKCSCNLLSHQQVAKEAYQDYWINAVIAYLEEDNRYDQQEGLVKIYYYCYKLLSQQSLPTGITPLQLLKQYLHQNEAYVSKEELRNIYMIIINFLIPQLNYQSDVSTYPMYRDQIIEWTDKILETYKPAAPIDFSHTIYNAVAVVLKVKMKTEKEYQQVADFINNKIAYIPKQHQRTFKSYNLGFMHFKRGEFLIDQQIEFNTKGKIGQELSSSSAYAIKIGYQQAKSAYEKAIKELVKYHFFEDVPRQLMARTALLRIYYDMPDKGDLKKATEEMNNYLTSAAVKNLSEGKFLVFQYFNMVIERLQELKISLDKSKASNQTADNQKKYDDLKTFITENTALLSYRQWLSQRLNAIWVIKK